jgi:hypothetical protein
MPRDNVEVVRDYVESLAQASPADVPGLIARFCDPQSDYYPVQKFPESRPCHGLEDITHFVSEFFGAWDEFDYGIEAVTAVADDRVLVRTRLSGTGRGSGLDMVGQVFICFWLRNGLVFRQEDHLTLAGARTALGLAEVDLL